MKLLFYLGHPAHYHNISQLLPDLTEKGYEPLLVARDKDVLLRLLEGLPYRIIHLPARKGSSKLSITGSTLKREWRILRLVLKEKPAALIGTDIVIAHVGSWTSTPSILINEDDSQAVPYLAHLGFRYASRVISPRSCDISPYEKKKIPYEGVHELAYLHPDRFQPDPSRIRTLNDPEAPPYILIRTSALRAHHDKGVGGLDEGTVRELIQQCHSEARVRISSEKELPADLQEYGLDLPPEEIHHVLAFAELLIGDSQTMTAEAACLGTPSVRFSDFKGRLSYLEALEQEHGLTFGFDTGQRKEMMERVDELLQRPGLKKEWRDKRDAFLQTCDDPLEVIRDTIQKIVEKKATDENS